MQVSDLVWYIRRPQARVRIAAQRSISSIDLSSRSPAFNIAALNCSQIIQFMHGWCSDFQRISISIDFLRHELKARTTVNRYCGIGVHPSRSSDSRPLCTVHVNCCATPVQITHSYTCG